MCAWVSISSLYWLSFFLVSCHWFVKYCDYKHWYIRVNDCWFLIFRNYITFLLCRGSEAFLPYIWNKYVQKLRILSLGWGITFSCSVRTWQTTASSKWIEQSKPETGSSAVCIQAGGTRHRRLCGNTKLRRGQQRRRIRRLLQKRSKMVINKEEAYILLSISSLEFIFYIYFFMYWYTWSKNSALLMYTFWYLMLKITWIIFFKISSCPSAMLFWSSVLSFWFLLKIVGLMW